MLRRMLNDKSTGSFGRNFRVKFTVCCLLNDMVACELAYCVRRHNGIASISAINHIAYAISVDDD